ncbi:unnamed protein product, partial [Hapterophycus canaliculatus]
QPTKKDPLEGGDGTIDDLKEALVENLEQRGVLGKLKARVMAEVFHTLEGPQEGLLPPPLSNENLLINELVRDYLSYNGYANALGVFMAESGQPSDRSLDRTFIRDELGLTERRVTPAGDGGRPLPLLYGITHALKRQRKRGYSQEGESEGTQEEEEEETDADGKKGSYPGMNWADPEPILFTKHSEDGGKGVGRGTA